MSVQKPVRTGVLCLALAASGASVGQQPAPDSTGTGGGSDSTITAPNTSTTGTTKPPGVEEGPETPADRRELKRVRREDDRIDKGVCEGCN